MIKKTSLIMLVCLVFFISTNTTVFAFGLGAKGPDVFAVQSMLKSMGYYPGQIDGHYGAQTESGVRLFQKSRGLPDTGSVDGKTLEAILWAYGNLKIPRQQPTPQVPDKKQPQPQKGVTAEEQEMINLVNRERNKEGLPNLKIDLELTQVARAKSKDMIEQNYFSHQSPVYGSPFEMIQSFGIQYKSAGENLACNNGVEAAHQALMESQGHRENILNAGYTHIGIGIVDGGRCGKMFTQLFISK